MAGIKDFKELLKVYGQGHVLHHYDGLSEEQQEFFKASVEKINFPTLSQGFVELYERTTSPIILDNDMRPLPSMCIESEQDCTPDRLTEYYNSGLKEVSKGAVAVISVPGEDPLQSNDSCLKAITRLDIPSNKSLYQLHAERIQQVQKLANERHSASGKIVWYIMCSQAYHQQVEDYLTSNHFFGLDRNNVIFFNQGTVPCFDFDGKLILEGAGAIAFTPDGNGGVFDSLRSEHVISDMKSRGVNHIHIHGIDNILTKVADPTFIGYCISRDAECAVKAVQKKNAAEPVGVLSMINNKVAFVESTQYTDKIANMKYNNGELVFNSVDILNYIFTATFLEKAAYTRLPFRIFKKVIPYANQDLQIIKPTSENGCVMGKRIYDIFDSCASVCVWTVARESNYSVLRSIDGGAEGYLDTARSDLFRLHKQYLQAANVVVTGNDIEISPLVSYSGENLQRFAGKSADSPFYLSLGRSYSGNFDVIEKNKLLQEDDKLQQKEFGEQIEPSTSSNTPGVDQVLQQNEELSLEEVIVLPIKEAYELNVEENPQMVQDTEPTTLGETNTEGDQS